MYFFFGPAVRTIAVPCAVCYLLYADIIASSRPCLLLSVRGRQDQENASSPTSSHKGLKAGTRDQLQTWDTLQIIITNDACLMGSSGFRFYLSTDIDAEVSLG